MIMYVSSPGRDGSFRGWMRVVENLYIIVNKFLDQNPKFIGECGNVKVRVSVHYLFLMERFESSKINSGRNRYAFLYFGFHLE
jgi:hypothetical protein